MCADKNSVEIAEQVSSNLFHQILDMAISGKGKLTGAKAIAGRLMTKHKDPELAIKQLITEHIALASGQGFATNWGGFFVSLATIPANLAAATFLQARMVSGIAHLRGHELTDPRVRTAIAMIMLGPTASAALISKGVLPSSPGAVATAPVFDPDLDGQVCKALADHHFTQLSGKRLGAFVAKRIPLLGGGVGAAVDGWNTRAIAHHALAELQIRRPRTTA